MTQKALLCIQDAKLRGLFSLLLGDMGCRVTACSEAAYVEELLQGNEYALFILGHENSVSSAEMLGLIRRCRPQGRILLLAQKEAVDEIPPLMRIGFDELIFMPINARRCVESLRGLLAQSRESAVLQPESAHPSAAGLGLFPSRSPAMQTILSELARRRDGCHGVLLCSENGSEIEQLARHYHLLCGGLHVNIPVLHAPQITEDALTETIALARMDDDTCVTLLIDNAESLLKEQQAIVVEQIKKERSRRVTGKPCRLVLSFTDGGDTSFLEELQLLLPPSLNLPPLRERKEDILPAARQLLAMLSTLYPSLQPRGIDRGLAHWLEAQAWPGNYAQLIRTLSDAILNAKGRTLYTEHIRAHLRPAA